MKNYKAVNFEIAKLLKEKRFEGSKSPLFYYKDGTLHKTPTESYKGLKCWNTWDATQGVRWDAPTIVEVVMWLYENHGIWICVDKAEDFNWWKFSIRKLNDIGYERIGFGSDYNSPTEAYEGAITYTLENIIKGGNNE
jgi:hypothetical protein